MQNPKEIANLSPDLVEKVKNKIRNGYNNRTIIQNTRKMVNGKRIQTLKGHQVQAIRTTMTKENNTEEKGQITDTSDESPDFNMALTVDEAKIEADHVGRIMSWLEKYHTDPKTEKSCVWPVDYISRMLGLTQNEMRAALNDEELRKRTIRINHRDHLCFDYSHILEIERQTATAYSGKKR